MVAVVKLKTPSAGRGTVTVQGVGAQVGLNAPSAPVLPLEKVCAAIGVANSKTAATVVIPRMRFIPSSDSATSRPHGPTEKLSAPFVTLVEFPAGASTINVRVPVEAVGAIDTFAVRMPPPGSALTFVTVMAASCPVARANTSPLAPARFAPVTVKVKLLPFAPLLGLIDKMTGALATLADWSTTPGENPIGATPNLALAEWVTVPAEKLSAGLPSRALAASSA
jgi:hypothetical protein